VSGLAVALLGCASGNASSAPHQPVQSLSPGDYEFRLSHDGRERRYLVHVPPGARGGAPLPVVLSFHGGAGHAANQKAYTRLDETADRERFLAVYPDGTGPFANRIHTWNAGTCCGWAQEHAVDDVGFVRRVLEDLGDRVALDPTRVYATGLSNGAMMAYRLAVEAADRITAIAPVAGAMVIGGGTPSRSVPVMHIHSVDDARALYAGGLGPPFPITRRRVAHPPVAQSLARWIELDGCPPEPRVQPTHWGEAGSASEGHSATLSTYGPCRDGVEVAHWKLTGAGHVWPGGKQEFLERILGPSTTIIDANTEIWRFFSRFTLPR